jgi:DNA-binding SARP family transcriptional activator
MIQASAMEAVCQVGLLGGFTVEVSGRRIPDDAWRHRRGADLVKVLALAPGHRLHREQVMQVLWPDFPAEAAGANLRKATYFARRALGGESAIGVQGGMISLWPGDELVVDVEEFERTAPGDPEAAIALYGGDLLPGDRYADWTEPHRERLRRRFLDLLRSAEDWERVLEFDHADEEAHRALMRAHLEAGRRQAAIRQFERLRQTLRTDLGVGSQPETVALFERALDAGVEPLTPRERAQALIARGLVHWNLWELDDAERIARQARAFALEHGLGRELGEASTLLGLAALARRSWREVFRAEFLDVVEKAPEHARFVLDGHLCMAVGSLYAWDGEATARLARELLAVAERAGTAHGQALMRLLIGGMDLFAGRIEDAEALLSEALALYRSVGSGSGEALSLLWLAEAALAGDRRGEAAGLLARARPLADASDLAAHLQVRVFAGMVRSAVGVEEQLDLVAEAERALVRSQVCGPCSIGYRVASAIACAESGEIGRARRCLGEAERLAGLWRGGPWLAATWEARAHLRRAEGDSERANALLQEAHNLFAESGRPLDASRCLATVTGVGLSGPGRAGRR